MGGIGIDRPPARHDDVSWPRAAAERDGGEARKARPPRREEAEQSTLQAGNDGARKLPPLPTISVPFDMASAIGGSRLWWVLYPQADVFRPCGIHRTVQYE